LNYLLANQQNTVRTRQELRSKRRSWSGRKIKRVASLPPALLALVALIAPSISDDAKSYPTWNIIVAIGVAAALGAMQVAAQVARPGVPLDELDKENPSIR
jgi:hypothetical protein